MFSLQQNQRTRGWNRFCPETGVVVGEEMGVGKSRGKGEGSGATTMYTHVSKCKNIK
jgi:hypothetical protein